MRLAMNVVFSIDTGADTVQRGSAVPLHQFHYHSRACVDASSNRRSLRESFFS